ncbi:MAG: flagellar brake protein [Rubrivivax sp.]|jgi:c-di-GMP-binding flagellar brake protein YcgR|nr:flagellar brake protein [Rubrivivax sp.]
MFQDTRPAQLDAAAGTDAWAPFRIDHPGEVLAMLRRLRDGSVPVILNAPAGAAVTTTLWTLDDRRSHLGFSVPGNEAALEVLVDGDEAVAVAYLDHVKLQFDLDDLVLVHGARDRVLRTAWPVVLYRFQRRDSYRVRTLERHAPTARLRHPAIAEMSLALRVLDVSSGGCAILVPGDVPPLEPGLTLHAVRIELDGDTRFVASLLLHHVTSIPNADRGVRIGCEWTGLDAAAARALQRYIDQTQKRRRLLALD